MFKISLRANGGVHTCTTLATVSSVLQAAQGGVAVNAFRNLNCIIITKIHVIEPEMQYEPEEQTQAMIRIKKAD